MQIGVFAKTFPRDSIEANLDAVRDHGFQCTQYNLSCAGLPTLPDIIFAELCQRVRVAHKARSLSMAALSGTFNIIDPEIARLEANMRRFEALAAATAFLGAGVITLCTGTCDCDDLWRPHPANSTVRAWHAMLKSLARLIRIAERAGVIIAIEPEPSNVVDSAQKARRALDTMNSPNLKIVFDAANLLENVPENARQSNLEESLQLLARDTAIIHVKELNVCKANTDPLGGFEYLRQLLRCMTNLGYDTPLIVHGVAESRATAVGELLRQLLDEVANPCASRAS